MKSMSHSYSQPNSNKKKEEGYRCKSTANSKFTMSEADPSGSFKPQNFRLKIPIDIYIVLLFLRQKVHPYEFAFEGIIDVDQSEKNTFRLRKIFIPPQTARVDNVRYDILTCNIATEEEMELLSLHGHSHANMDAFWSQTDINDIEDWLGPYRINIVINNFGKMLARIDFFVETCGDNIHVGTANVDVELEFGEEYEKKYSGLLANIKRTADPVTTRPYYYGYPVYNPNLRRVLTEADFNLDYRDDAFSELDLDSIYDNDSYTTPEFSPSSNDGDSISIIPKLDPSNDSGNTTITEPNSSNDDGSCLRPVDNSI